MPEQRERYQQMGNLLGGQCCMRQGCSYIGPSVPPYVTVPCGNLLSRASLKIGRHRSEMCSLFPSLLVLRIPYSTAVPNTPPRTHSICTRCTSRAVQPWRYPEPAEIASTKTCHRIAPAPRKKERKPARQDADDPNRIGETGPEKKVDPWDAA